MYLGELKQITQKEPTWKGLRNWVNLLCSRSRRHAGCMTHSLKLSMEAQWFLAVPNRFATRVFQHRSYMFGCWFHFFIFHNIWDIWDVILPIDFHIFQDGWNHQPVYVYFPSPDVWWSTGSTSTLPFSRPYQGGGGGAGCSHLVECDLGTRIHAGSLGLFLVDVQCLGFSCFSRFKCNIYCIWPVHACFLRMCNL
jgi:hypothetical protein